MCVEVRRYQFQCTLVFKSCFPLQWRTRMLFQVCSLLVHWYLEDNATRMMSDQKTTNIVPLCRASMECIDEHALRLETQVCCAS